MHYCPTCNRPVQYDAKSLWRPFCSERCKLIDLGAWASERHVIPGETRNMDEPSESDLPTTQEKNTKS
jgi:endogenous inhibitor of DNA gyrase (YacG/DUF329 family)